MSQNFVLEWAALSDTGVVRTKNEDAVYIDAQNSFGLLADGLGGYKAGEVASRMAVEGISAGLRRFLTQDAVGESHTLETDLMRATLVLERCVERVNHDIHEGACTQPEHLGMATTLVAMWALRGQLLIGHVGDSRGYRWRKRVLSQLTRDHSVMQEELDAGLLRPEETASYGYRNLLTRGLGVEPSVQLETLVSGMQEGDYFMMCSDGLTDMVSDVEIAVVFDSGLPVQDMAQVLVQQANLNGGQDNISVAILHVLAPGAGSNLAP